MSYKNVNQIHWDIAARVHKEAPKGYYDIQGFNEGKLSLKKIHMEELGDLEGKKVLHLLCHIGLDTLSMARLGAEVVGVDLSPESIAAARELAEANGLEAEFICSDVYGIEEVVQGEFDIIYASHGVICWLEDLGVFMKIVQGYLKPGGFFYLMDGHPMSIIMSNDRDGKNIEVVDTYFKSSNLPNFCEGSEDYGNKEVVIEAPTYEWKHSLSEIINAVCSSGLQLEFLHEHPFCDDQYYENMIQDEEGWWRFQEGDMIPLMFSVKAEKR